MTIEARVAAYEGQRKYTGKINPEWYEDLRFQWELEAFWSMVGDIRYGKGKS